MKASSDAAALAGPTAGRASAASAKSRRRDEPRLCTRDRRRIIARSWSWALAILRGPGARLILEQQRRELVEAPPPALPLVGRVRGFVVGVLDAQLFQRLVVRLGCGVVLPAAVA